MHIICACFAYVALLFPLDSEASIMDRDIYSVLQIFDAYTHITQTLMMVDLHTTCVYACQARMLRIVRMQCEGQAATRLSSVPLSMLFAMCPNVCEYILI